MKQDDIFYEAMLARDPRFDGKFFVGVKTTQIYCRPICPAKPKRENVEFFKSHWEAEQAGYRPCLRCRPESAPLSPVWIGKSATVQRAIKILHRQDTLDLNENQFANLLGISARHLRRIFLEEMGKTPKQLFFENRLNLARNLIIETRLPIAEISFAAGFRSVRRFNDSFKKRFKRKPSEIRRIPIGNENQMNVSLSYRPPFDFEGLIRFYQSHRVGNLEWFQDGKMFRVLEIEGKVGQIAIANDARKSRVLLQIDFPDTSKIHRIVTNVRNLLDLNSDPLIIANTLEMDDDINTVFKKHPGIRLPSGWDPFEVAVSTILGQLVSVDRGRALVGDLIELLGKDSGRVLGGKPIQLFPTPLEIASSSLAGLKTTQARRQTLIRFARAVVEGEITLEPTQNVEDFLEKVLAIQGIGPWTANYMALRVLRHTDAFPATDLILARALEIHSRETVDRMSPWRGYAAVLFWREYAETLRKNGRKGKS
jgi:AraC family transcriptional regulator of adaptative response / DNA-3-methyladenine glycosylase II